MQEDVSGLHHVQITVEPSDEMAARAFYGEVLGLREVSKPEVLRARGGAWFELADGRHLHIGLESGVDRMSTRAHVAYSVADIDAWRTRLAAHDVAFEEPVDIPGWHRLQFRDPFGNRVELVCVVV